MSQEYVVIFKHTEWFYLFLTLLDHTKAFGTLKGIRSRNFEWLYFLWQVVRNYKFAKSQGKPNKGTRSSLKHKSRGRSSRYQKLNFFRDSFTRVVRGRNMVLFFYFLVTLISPNSHPNAWAASCACRRAPWPGEHGAVSDSAASACLLYLSMATPDLTRSDPTHPSRHTRPEVLLHWYGPPST